MPLLGAVVSIGASLIGTSAAGPNRDAAAAIFPAAIGGNLAAVQAFRSRASSGGTASSVQPWAAGLQTIPKSLQDAAEQAVVAGKIPREWWSGVQPSQIAGLVQRYAGVTANPSPLNTLTAAPGAPEGPASDMAAKTFGATGFPLWLLVAGGAVAAFFIYKAMKKG